ncbi:MAG: hypothetical protein K2M64_01775, partial [Clostridia bacterium]|nr:hypothetical protein [Clostridia bacterium]
ARTQALKVIEDAKAKAREEERAKTEAKTQEEREKAQREIEHWRSLAEMQPVDDGPDAPSARYYIPRTDGKLIRKIEELSKGGPDDEAELLATIQNLLDGLD